MLLSHVEAFLGETARHRNLSRAAEVLHVTQPALTAQIPALEAELETPLFVRRRRGVDLTERHQAFLPYAERAVGGAGNSGANLIRELRRGGAGELVLGAAPAVSAYVLPRLLLRSTRSATRGSGWWVRTGHSEEIVDMAVRREIDLGLVRELPSPRHRQSGPSTRTSSSSSPSGSHAFGDRGHDRPSPNSPRRGSSCSTARRATTT